MSWNEDYRDLSKNICGDYYYLELSSSIPLIISNIYSDTLTPEFRVFLSNCCIADKI
jgi:hypothetical protein